MSAENVVFGIGAVMIIDLSDGKRFDFTHQMTYKVTTDHSLVDLRDSSGSLTDTRNGESTYQIELAANDIPPMLCDRYMGATTIQTAAAAGLSFLSPPVSIMGDSSTLVGQITTAGATISPTAAVGSYVATRDSDGDVAFARVGTEADAAVVLVTALFTGTIALTGSGEESVLFHIVSNKQIGHIASYKGNPKRPRFKVIVTSSPPQFTGLIETMILPVCVPEGGAFESERLAFREGTLTFKLIGGEFTRETAPIKST